MRKLVSILLIIPIVFTSCSDEEFDLNPTTGVTEETAFASLENAQKTINGVYKILYTQYTNQHRDGQGACMINLDAMGEDYVRNKSGYSYFRNSYKWTAHRNVDDTNVLGFMYEFYYIVISNVNMIIENIDAVEGDDDTKNQIKGEAYALRGWAHFQLVQLWGKRYDPANGTNDQAGVPIMITTSTEGQPRSTVEEVYTQINADLDAALASLVNSEAVRTDADKVHINTNVVYGFKARVALTMQNFTDAVSYAKLALNDVDYLMTNDEYLEGFTDMSNGEWLWGVRQTDDQVPTYGSFYGYMSANYNSVFTRVNPKCINSLLYDQISATDIRHRIWWDGTDETKDDFPDVGTQTKVQYMHRKYLVADVSTRAGDIPYMRNAEMYLIQAEAYARNGNDADAASVLYDLAVNRDPSYTLSTNTGDDLIDEIMVQRRIELWGEGFRFLDLKRTNAPLDRTNSNQDPDLCNITYVDAGDDSWQWLIPQDEIESNPAITTADQNQ